MKGNVLQTPDENRRMFDAIAGRYDLLNRVLSVGRDRYWRRFAVGRLLRGEGGRYMDVGAGTGDVCLEIARQAPGCEVVGIDRSRGMLDLAEAKVRESGSPDRISFEVADAADLPFEDGGFDGVITAFTFRNIRDRSRAVGEMARVLRPGGRLVILELTSPQGKAVRFLHRIYNRIVVPTAGRLLSRGEAYSYLIRSIEDFPAAGIVLDAMAAAGLRDTIHEPLSGGVVTVFSGTR